MACRTTRQLLDHIKSFHRQLADFYKQSAKQADQAKAKALLKYMGRNEEHLEDCLAAYEEGAAQAVLDTWFEFMPEIAKCECFERIEVFSKVL